MVKCIDCGIEKEASEYYWNNTKLNGLNSYCKDCANKRSKARYKEHREELIVYSKSRSKLPHVKATRKRYVEKNRERILNYYKEWYIKNREKKLAKNNAYNRNKKLLTNDKDVV